ncbi:phosphatidate cytidylyltransferase [Legionella jamestowniensis]|uniref:Phosphatidate cytidylyltransferase n=1 Tax=Legionella jamestowniensis TaxID=455 RepID=A0A0W0UKQ4_9GAMM|nr:phosphatidate cytidylyltransferase [Legionella jamestowniensis]KTD08458.1 phosphatidate cytidylyltransferase [Legionella jamestowniensis]OCH97076.1 phosphatidate cytidylyltransferase [Legionella jamestowniensis]SFL51340.1 phosphatidate cytidylyltransferase [Legionella jamestowniensis DSM 19215]
MFRQRLITTLILVPLVLLALYYATNLLFASMITLLLLGCAVEWLQLIPLKQVVLKFAFIGIIFLLAWVSQFAFNSWLFAGFIVWFLILVAVISFPASEAIWGHPLVVALAGLLVLPLFAQSLINIHAQEQGKALILYLLLLIWAADIGAYLAGKQWGRHKLIPAVSPGKTIEGSLGGFILALLIALIAYFYFQPQKRLVWFGIAAATALISILGDLFISILKRRAKLKDTGHLLPGHGGVLDRLDSLIAASPLFYWSLRLLAPGQ